MSMQPRKVLHRYPKSLTDEALERDILTSTPKGNVAGRELYLDFSDLTEADFHTAGRLVGACEGFLRRDGSLRIVPPSTRATADEAHQLAVPITSESLSSFRKTQAQLARHVQDRSRASRFLQRVGFLEAARCGHLDGTTVAVDSVHLLPSENEQAGLRVTPTPLAGQGQLLEVTPYDWLPIATEPELSAALKRTGEVLTRVGVGHGVRQAVHELAQNVHEHSLFGESGLSSLGIQHMLFGVATRTIGEETLVEILVVDGGVTIPDTLSADFRAATGREGTQSEVVAHAFGANSTRKQGTQVEGSARGLAVVLSAVRNAGGSMSVRSGTGEVILRDGVLGASAARHGFQPGTAFSLSIPFDRNRRPPRIGLADDEVIEPLMLDIDTHILYQDGTFDRMVTLGPKSLPATQEPTVVFVEPGCSRVDLERFLSQHIVPNSVVIAASTDGQSSLLRDQIEAILAAQSPTEAAAVLVFDRLEPALLHGPIEFRMARGLIRAVVERFAAFVADAVQAAVSQSPLDPRRTWSLEVADRWIEPRQLIDVVAIRVLAPVVLAFRVAQQIAESDASDLTVLDIVVTDPEFKLVAEAVAGWLGARYVRAIRVPQEPDSALLVDEIEAASVILTPVIHGGGATVPIVRGLLASGRRSITVCSFVDSRLSRDPEFQVAGHLIPVVAACTSSAKGLGAAAAALEADSLEQIRVELDGVGDEAAVHKAIAASPGALSLGHFHSENRAWMSAVIAPSAIADPTTAIGRLIIEGLTSAIRREVDALCPGATLDIRDLAEPTPLTGHLQEALGRDRNGSQSGGLATVLVDWGALTGETAVRGALAESGNGAEAIIVAIGVDRAAHGAHHLLSRCSITLDSPPEGQIPGTTAELEQRQVALSFVSAVEFPRDHRSEIDCPLCATERSLLRVRSMPTTLLNSRLRMLRVRTSSDPPRTETVDSFEVGMSDDDVRRFLAWRSILHRGTKDCPLAHGVALRLDVRDAGLGSADLIALARNLVLNPDLLRRRPWSSPRFRHALGESLAKFLRSNDGLSISSSMARQLITVLRMASKSIFARQSGAIYSQWMSPDVREELEVGVATMLRDNISNALLEAATSAVAEFEANWSPDAKSTSIGALKSDVTKLRSSRLGDPARQARWNEAAEKLIPLPTHMGLGGATGRLPILLANVHELHAAARDTVTDSAQRLLHEIQRFVEVEFPSIQGLIEAEYESLVLRGAADPFPSQSEWSSAVDELHLVIEELRSGAGRHRRDVQTLVEAVIAPLSTSSDSKSFASIALSASAELGEAVKTVGEHYEAKDCLVTAPKRKGNVLFPRLPLHDLVAHLIENGLKHHCPDSPRLEIRFELPTNVEDSVHRRLRVSYTNIGRHREPNPKGGLSEDQWGGALAAFGGRILLPPTEESPDSSFTLELYFQRPWGDTS